AVADFPTRAAAARSPLARAIFALPEVARVFFGADFISVTKADSADWRHLKVPVLAAIMDHFTRDLPIMDGASEEVDDAASYGEADPEVVAQIRELIDTRVRPAVAQDGGDIIYKGFDGGSGGGFLALQGSGGGR